jgi:hypothetical protein
MNTNANKEQIAFETSILAPEFVTNMLKKYRDKFGDNIAKLAHALGIGGLMADYHIELTDFDQAPTGSEEQLAEIYMQFRNGVFYDPQGRPVRPGFTVGIADRVNKRDVYVLVGLPGHNVVVYQKTPDEAAVSKIGLLAHDTMRRALRMSPEWKDGNNHDKVMMASFLGLDYDRHDDELVVPYGRLESSASIGRQLAVTGL